MRVFFTQYELLNLDTFYPIFILGKANQQIVPAKEAMDSLK